VFGIAAGNLAHKSVELVYTCCAGEKHERALARDYLNSALLAECDCLLADRSFPARYIQMRRIPASAQSDTTWSVTFAVVINSAASTGG
jgi:hypothetical protein